MSCFSLSAFQGRGGKDHIIYKCLSHKSNLQPVFNFLLSFQLRTNSQNEKLPDLLIQFSHNETASGL